MRVLRSASLAVLLAACLSDSPSGPTVAIGDLALTPANIRMGVGESRELLCQARDAVGQVLPTLPPVTWLVPAVNVAVLEQVSTSDRSRQRLTATGVGSSTVRCRYEGFTASALINVVPFTVTATGAPTALSVGQTAAFSVSVTTPDGAPVDLVPPFRVVWSSSAVGVLTVQEGPTPGSALVTAVGPGTATILASIRSFTDVGEVGQWTGVVTVTGGGSD